MQLLLGVACFFTTTTMGGKMGIAPKSELMTVTETCDYLKITPRTLYRYLQSRQIPAFKLGKEWRFVRSDLEQWIRDRTRNVVHS
jgi:excisionase family DNA binding protein